MIKKEFVSKEKDKVLNIVSKNNVSYQTANKLLRKKDIKVDGKRISKNLDVFPGQTITIYLEEETNLKYFEKVYEDENILVVNKFKGIEVTESEELSLEKILNSKTSKYIAVNRLDRNTEGLTIFAKSRNVFVLLKKAQKNKEIKKSYLAEVVGQTNFNNKKIVSYLLKDKDKSLVKIFSSPVKESKKIESTITTISNSSGKTSLLLVEIFGGKTHQIRAQLSFLGFPIIGDGKYGKNLDNKKFKTKTQKLTAFKLDFNFLNEKLKYLNNLELKIKPSWLGEGEN